MTRPNEEPIPPVLNEATISEIIDELERRCKVAQGRHNVVFCWYTPLNDGEIRILHAGDILTLTGMMQTLNENVNIVRITKMPKPNIGPFGSHSRTF